MEQTNFKQKRQCPIFGVALLLAFTLSTHAQVTIGLGEQPVSGALLQLKDKENVTDGTFNAHKGLALPRVTLSEKKELYPMFLADPGNPASGPNADYSSGKAVLDKTHTGLIVYNLVEDDNKELCLGLNQWDGEMWNCFQSKMGNAKFDPVSCSDIEVNGMYVEGMVTTSANYISINLNVKKLGAFAITVTTGNGYNFYLSGVALSLGGMTVNVPCQGIPVVVQTDKLIFRGMELTSDCEPEVEVVSSVANYSLNCSTIEVNGQYLKGTALTASNTITLHVTVSTAGSYNITTPLTNGIYFSARGNLIQGTQFITLIGSGTPTINSDFPITINANTLQGNNTCSITVPVTLPEMTYAIIGSGVWSWAATPRTNALSNVGSASFNLDGLVRIKNFKELWNTSSVSTAITNLTNGVNGGKYPDIILYFAYGADPTPVLTTALLNYINAGGCVIYGSSDNTVTAVNSLMNGLFGISPAQSQAGGATSDDVYPISNFPNDPVINGPFGNLSGQYWGEDNLTTGSVIMTELPANSVQVCTARSASKTSNDPKYSIVWYNDNKNFFYFGDSVGASTTSSSLTEFPAKYNTQGLPQSKNYGTSGNTQFVYNSALELNAIAWALKKAAVSGINPY
jgi:hypothetical protein